MVYMKRTKRLEKYLKNNITLSFCHPDPDLMDIIDNTRTPETFVEFFFEVSNGDFPSDQDGYLDKKKSYRHPDHNCKEIHLPIDRNDEKNKNIKLKDGSDLWLYSEDHIEK